MNEVQTKLRNAAILALDYLRDPGAAETHYMASSEGSASARELVMEDLADALTVVELTNDCAGDEPEGPSPYFAQWMAAFCNSGAGAIAGERRRQVEEEKCSAEKDDAYVGRELAWAARAYLSAVVSREPLESEILVRAHALIFWPWSAESFKPKSNLEDLIRAGALIAAEIDRLLRISRKAEEASRAALNG